MASATQNDIKEKTKEKMNYIASRLNDLEPEIIGGLCIRLLIDNVQSFEQIKTILDEVKQIQNSVRR